jgi:hypothetical protein
MLEMKPLLSLWRDDPGGTYRTWFLWKDRLRVFGAIRRGLAEVVREIDGKIADCCAGGVNEQTLRAAGLGVAL